MELIKIHTFFSDGGGQCMQAAVQAVAPQAFASAAMQTQSWPDTRSSLELSTGRVDVWLVPLDAPFSEDCALDLLSSDELIRAERFHFIKDRQRFTRCRSALRFLLARYLGVPAAEIRFDYHPAGKPEVAAQQNPRGLRFNVSHSGRLALIAVCAGHRIGVDVEGEYSQVDMPALAERFFSLRERAGLGSLPDRLRLKAFFACWTRKESFLKATGAGLSFPPADFSVSTHPEFDPALEELRGNTEARSQWFLTDINVAQGFRAALAVENACFIGPTLAASNKLTSEQRDRRHRLSR